MRFVRLSEEERSKVETLYKTIPNSVVRTRCLSLLYSNEQRSIKEVSSLLPLSRRSLERFFNAWESASDKHSTLSIVTGRGAKIKLYGVKDLLPDLVKHQ